MIEGDLPFESQESQSNWNNVFQEHEISVLKTAFLFYITVEWLNNHFSITIKGPGVSQIG
jgi:hypothetical protein